MTFLTVRRPALVFAAMISAVALGVFALAPAIFAQGTPGGTRKVIQRHDTNAPGFEALLVEAEIPVGGREGRHTHPGVVLARLESGTLNMDYEGKPTAIYKPGDSFVIEAGKIHEGINKGNVPVKVIATFLVPKGAPLTTQLK